MKRKLSLILSLVILLFSFKYFWEYGHLQLNGIDRKARVVAYIPYTTTRRFSDKVVHYHRVKVGFEFKNVVLDKEYKPGYTFSIKYIPRQEGYYQVAGTMTKSLEAALALLFGSFLLFVSTLKAEAILGYIFRKLRI